MEKVLEVKNITKIYKNNRGVKDISFDIHTGDIYGFLGPNGAGKTTVMKIITGLLRASQGEVLLFGHNIVHEFEKAMGRVGCIIETADSYEYMSACQNLKMAARFYEGLNKNRIDEVLEIVGLSAYKNEKVCQFSLGMKQRLGIAAAILAQPDLLILDEPTNGLDIEGMADIRNLILKLAHERQVTFFVSSHLAHEMELICNRVGILNNGKLIKEGVVAQLLQSHDSLEDFFIQQAKEDRRNNVNE